MEPAAASKSDMGSYTKLSLVLSQDQELKSGAFFHPALHFLFRSSSAMVVGIAGCVMFCLSLSLEMQATLFVFAKWQGELNAKAVPLISLFGIPLMIFLLLFLLSQFACLFSDFLNKPAIPELRALIFVTLEAKSGDTMLVIDKVVIAVWFTFTCLPLTAILVNCAVFETSHGVHQYMPMFWWLCLCQGFGLLFVYTLVKFWVYFNPRQKRQYDMVKQLLAGCKSSQDFGSSFDGDGVDHGIEAPIMTSITAVAQRESFRGPLLSALLKLLVLFALLLFDAIIVAFRPFGYNAFVKVGGGVYTMVLYSLIAVFVMKGLPSGFARFFPVFFAAQFLIMIPLFGGFAGEVMQAGGHDSHAFFFTPPNDVSRADLAHDKKNGTAKRPYAVCQMSWGHADVSQEKRLTILDVWAFADSAYYSTDTLAEQLVASSITGTPLEVGVKALKHTKASVIGNPVLFEVPAAKTCVMAIRGTHTFADAAADGDMYSAIKAMHLISGVFPLLQLLPQRVVQHLARAFDLKYWLGATQVWDVIVDFAKDSKDLCDEKGYDLIVTGHSLGGGLAQIVAGKLDVTAITWSPVGTLYDLLHFDISADKLRRNVVNILPERDVVPKTDIQVGNNQDIACSSQSRLACHTRPIAACELILSCGDIRGRSHIDKSMSDYCRRLIIEGDDSIIFEKIKKPRSKPKRDGPHRDGHLLQGPNDGKARESAKGKGGSAKGKSGDEGASAKGKSADKLV